MYELTQGRDYVELLIMRIFKIEDGCPYNRMAINSMKYDLGDLLAQLGISMP